jgi:hypothetical protein
MGASKGRWMERPAHLSHAYSRADAIDRYQARRKKMVTVEAQDL